MHEWLALERQRAPFEVLAVEEARSVEIGGVRLELRLDRADRLDGGGDLLLDYKTGKAQTGELVRRPAGRAAAAALRARRAKAARPDWLSPAWRAATAAFEGLAERDDIAPGIEPLCRRAKGRTGDVDEPARALGARL